MPAPRKVDLLPIELRQWLQDELKTRGFGGYVELTEALNIRLEADGLELRLGKSAIHAYGQEFREYAKIQDQAQDEIRAFLEETTLNKEVDVTDALFQQLTTIAFRLQMAMSDKDKLPDARGLKDLTTALNNLVRSVSLRDTIRASLVAEQEERLEAAIDAGEIEKAAAQKAREIMGFS